ncbi:MAG: SUMF1/EgtB/PvdO family nonheme iron enzyme [Planctomycetota bacterium]|nr:SUMF1/EgtB/PvdO family nonheme iron enzyme [Planctomycetota bacterium]
MPAFGRFETGRRLFKVGKRWVYSAREQGAAADGHVVEVFELDPFALDPAQQEADAAAFLSVAAEQKKLVEGGARGWAPVVETGTGDEGAWYASTLFPLSAQSLIDQRVALAEKGLRAIVESTLRALGELDQSQINSGGRPHGALTPACVWIGPEGAAADGSARVVLSDFKPREQTTKVDRDADMQAVGRLIYQLVTQEAQVRDLMAWPVPMTPAWKALGENGAWWLELSNKLTNPNPGAVLPTIAEVLERLSERKVASVPGTKKRLLVGVAAGVVLLGIAGGAYVALSGSKSEKTIQIAEGSIDVKDWEELVDASKNWFFVVRGLPKAMETDATLASDPLYQQIRQIIEPDGAKATFPVADMKGSVAGVDDKLNPPQANSKQGGRAVETLNRIRQVRELLRGDGNIGWERARGLRAAGESFAKQGQEQLAENLLKPLGQLDEVLDAKKPIADVRDLTDRVGAINAAFESFRPIAEAQSKLAKVREEAEKLPDPVLKRLGEVIDAEQKAVFASGKSGEALLTDLRTRLDALVTRGQGAVNLFTRNQAQWDLEGFYASEFMQAGAAAAPTLALIEGWQAEFSKPVYAPPSDPDPRTAQVAEATAWLDERTKTLDTLKQTKSDDEDVMKDGPRLAEQATQFRSALAAVQEPKWLNRNIPKITADLKLARDGAARWRDEVDTLQKIVVQGAAGIVDKARNRLSDPDITASEAIKSYWTGAVAALDKKKDAVSRKALATELDQLEATVKALNEGVNVPSPLPAGAERVVNTEAVARAIVSRKERTLAAAVGQLGQPGSANAAAVRQINALQEFVAWNSAVGQTVATLQGAAELLDAGYMLAEPGPKQASASDLIAQAEASPAWAEIKDAAGALPARREALNKLGAETQPGALIAAVENGQTLAERRTAWAKLASADPAAAPGAQTVAWPRSAQDLDALSSASAALDAKLATIEDSARAGALRQALAQDRRTLIVRHLNSLDGSEGAVRGSFAKIAAMKDSGLSADQLAGRAEIEGLSAAARFNLALLAFDDAVLALNKATPGDQQPAQLQALIAGLQQQAQALGIADAKITKMLADAAALSAAGAKKFEPEKEGPARTGRWAGQVVSDGVVDFTRTGGGVGPSKLRFRRVQPSGQDKPTYVLTSEVSVGLVKDAIDAVRPRDPAPAFLSPINDPGRRSGPIVWIAAGTSSIQPSGGVQQPIMSGNRWYRYHASLVGVEYFPASIAPTPPDAGAPMTQVSIAGALFVAQSMGTRLPTPAELAAAAGANGGAVNLRDARFKQQFDHVKGLIAGNAQLTIQYPASGAFHPSPIAERPKPNEDDRTATTDDDGFLFFAPAGEGADGFVNVIGNAAEWALGNRDGMDALAEEPAGSLAFARAREFTTQTGALVFGGSALSHPDLPKDQPLKPATAAEPNSGYADVGFRLAFTELGSRKTPAELVREVVQAAGFVGRR